MTEIDASLRRLGTDYVDLYQIHRWDRRTPIEETMEALHDVVKAGKARYIGASSMYAWQFAKAQHVAERTAGRGSSRMQNHYNLLYREEEREMMPLCARSGRRRHPVEPAGPRPAHPRLATSTTPAARPTSSARRSTQRPTTDDRRAGRRDRRRARRAACRRSRWPGCPQHPAVTAPIVGATKPHHLDDAVASVDLALTADEIPALEEPYTPQPVYGF